MNEKQLSRLTTEQQLLSKEAIKLPHRQRLELLLKAKRYPIVRKRTSAEGQIKEMIDFYNLCCVMLAQYFPNEEAENNFFMLSFIASQEDSQSIITEKFAEAFKMLRDYEELERKVTAIQMLFYQYHDSFPELYESYDLEDIATERISDVIQGTRELMNNDPQYIEEILNRWELLS